MKIVMAKMAVDYLRSSPPAQHACPVPEKPDRLSIELVAGSASNHVLPEPCGEDFHAMMAARHAVHQLAQHGHGTGGLILLDRDGHPGFAFNTPRMAYGYVCADSSFSTAV